MSKRIVTFGEILLRLSPPSHLRLTQATSFDLYYGCAKHSGDINLATVNEIKALMGGSGGGRVSR